MKKKMMLCTAAAIVLFLATSSGVWAGVPPPEGGVLPDFTLATPRDSGERDYLKLSFISQSFRIPELETQVAIIEIFSMYCPYCQAEAPNVNRLYDIIEGNPRFKGKIKIILRLRFRTMGSGWMLWRASTYSFHFLRPKAQTKGPVSVFM